eukprot:5919768-Heterocapsa_arctica.AAC.1
MFAHPSHGFPQIPEPCGRHAAVTAMTAVSRVAPGRYAQAAQAAEARPGRAMPLARSPLWATRIA